MMQTIVWTMHYLTWQNSHWLYRIKGCFCELGVFGPPFICEILLLPGEYNPFLFFLCSSHKILLQGSLQQLPLLLWLWLAAWLVRGRTGRLAVGAAQQCWLHGDPSWSCLPELAAAVTVLLVLFWQLMAFARLCLLLLFQLLLVPLLLLLLMMIIALVYTPWADVRALSLLPLFCCVSSI